MEPRTELRMPHLDLRLPEIAPEDENVFARGLLGCMFEVNKGMPERWLDVLHGLSEGRTCTELFPDALYDSGIELSKSVK